jgi:fatty-acyl-CoA synthase
VSLPAAPLAAATFAELLLRRRDDERPALMCGEHTWTWRQLIAEALIRAELMRSLRRPGAFHVGVLLENTPEYVAWIYGAAFARATVVGINSTRRGESLAADIHHTDCQLIVTDTDRRGLLTGLDLGVGAERILEVDRPEFRDRCDRAAAFDPAADPPVSADLLLLLFTSGSTGAPKAVICTTGRLAVIATGAIENLQLRPDDRLYQSMPMFHGNAIMASLAPAVALGLCVVLRSRFSASGFLADVTTYDVTYFNYVGRSLAYVLATPATDDDADNRLRMGFGTEASLRDREQFSARFGCELIERYGSSEGVISTYRPPGTPENSIGLPHPRPGSDVTVIDPDTRAECPPARFDAGGALLNADEAIGEIVDRGGAPGFEGYYNNDEANRARRHDGWYWSGDLAFRDADGFLFFAGRNTDWLRVDSENFASAPVETVIARHPDVVMAAVYAVPDPRTGDQVMTALELRDGAGFEPADFAQFLAAQPDLGTKWAPTFIRIVETMPLTATNKVDKAPLRRVGWTGNGVFWRTAGDLSYRPLSDVQRASLRAEFAEHGRTHLLTPP